LRLGGLISRVGEVVAAFAGRDPVEELAGGGRQCLFGASGGLAQQRLEFGEELLDRVAVGAVWRQVEDAAADRSDRLADAGDLVGSQRLSITTTSPGSRAGASACSM
jgi:hypothetical protein